MPSCLCVDVSCTLVWSPISEYQNTHYQPVYSTCCQIATEYQMPWLIPLNTCPVSYEQEPWWSWKPLATWVMLTTTAYRQETTVWQQNAYRTLTLRIVPKSCISLVWTSQATLCWANKAFADKTGSNLSEKKSDTLALQRWHKRLAECLQPLVVTVQGNIAFPTHHFFLMYSKHRLPVTWLQPVCSSQPAGSISWTA